MGSAIRIAVTGGAGQVAYSLLFRLAAGELFPGSPIALHILDLEETLPALEGVKMELQDCAFPLLTEVRVGSDPYKIFEGVQFVFLVGAKPRGPGMERKDLLQENGKIFQIQGKALNAVAAKDVHILVVGNPCNTNCLIALHNAPNIPPERFHAMTRLDQNRAHGFLAEKAKLPISAITNITIWGNHSTTQVPDFIHAKINAKPLTDVIKDRIWLEGDFLKRVQHRGAEIIKARGKSSAASAASAALDAMKSIYEPTPKGQWFSSGIYTNNNSYGIDKDLVFSFPCISKGKGECSEVKEIKLDYFLEEKIRLSEKELLEERSLVKDLL